MVLGLGHGVAPRQAQLLQIGAQARQRLFIEKPAEVVRAVQKHFRLAHAAKQPIKLLRNLSVAERTQPTLPGETPDAWATLLERHRGQHVLLVAHGGTIRMVLRRILDMPLRRLWRFEVPFAALSRVHWFHDPEADPRLVFHNGRVT